MRERRSWTPRIGNRPGDSGGAGLDDEVQAEHAKGALDAGDGGAVARVEHPAHGLFVDAESLGEGNGRDRPLFGRVPVRVRPWQR